MTCAWVIYWPLLSFIDHWRKSGESGERCIAMLQIAHHRLTWSGIWWHSNHGWQVQHRPSFRESNYLFHMCIMVNTVWTLSPSKPVLPQLLCAAPWNGFMSWEFYLASQASWSISLRESQKLWRGHSRLLDLFVPQGGQFAQVPYALCWTNEHVLHALSEMTTSYSDAAGRAQGWYDKCQQGNVILGHLLMLVTTGELESLCFPPAQNTHYRNDSLCCCLCEKHLEKTSN